MTSEALLKVEGLSVTIDTDAGPARVVRDLSFSLAAGKTLGIVGESGCGKSMTALAVVRLLPANAKISGCVELSGRDLLAFSEREMCRVRGNRIGMVFQEPMTALNPAQPIGRQVAEGLVVHGKMGWREASGEALRLLERVGIPDTRRRSKDYPHQFSGGQRQRIVIAIALACQPAVLIADEPTTALDVTVQAQILDLLEELAHSFRMAMILISHDLGVIGRLCDDVLVMYAGTSVETGAAERVFDTPAHPYTRGLFGALPEMQQDYGATLYTIPGLVPDPVALPNGCTFADRCAFVRTEAGCRAAEPPLTSLRAVHSVRCVRAGEIGPWSP